MQMHLVDLALVPYNGISTLYVDYDVIFSRQIHLLFVFCYYFIMHYYVLLNSNVYYCTIRVRVSVFEQSISTQYTR